MSDIPRSERQRLIKLIHIAQKQLALDEGDYRAFLEGSTGGKRSCAECTGIELKHAYEGLKRLGFKPSIPDGASLPNAADNAQVNLIRSMWLDLGRRGIVRNGAEAALNNFVKRQTGVERVEWLYSKRANQVIEALKAMGERG